MLDNRETVHWRKASYTTQNGACVELARTSDMIVIRDSKSPVMGMIKLDRAAFATIVERVRKDGLDVL